MSSTSPPLHHSTVTPPLTSPQQRPYRQVDMPWFLPQFCSQAYFDSSDNSLSLLPPIVQSSIPSVFTYVCQLLSEDGNQENSACMRYRGEREGPEGKMTAQGGA
jgi:hypothetical protein